MPFSNRTSQSKLAVGLASISIRRSCARSQQSRTAPRLSTSGERVVRSLPPASGVSILKSRTTIAALAALGVASCGAPDPERASSGKTTDTLPLSATRTVSFTTDEGTWMSVDVSPDGSTVLFDMLGDLYTLPIAGGEARVLTSGLAYSDQPRYSPATGSRMSATLAAPMKSGSCEQMGASDVASRICGARMAMKRAKLGSRRGLQMVNRSS